ncbi:MAG: efflux transporter outer membrane subunit [Lautropia sp.]
MRAGGPLALALLAAGCAITTPDPRPPAPPATAWQAALPHGGEVTQLAQWWQRFDDPILLQLIEAGQRDNPGLAAAVARIDQARATARVAGAGRLPSVDLNSQITRTSSPLPPSITSTVAAASLDAGWELDLFGANRRTREAAVARVAARTADWHAARVSLAAETATAYANLRLCESLLTVYRQDLDSQRRTLSLTERKVRAGFTAPADAALITAGGAEAANRVRGQRGECDLLIKSLVTLTAMPEPALRQTLAPRAGRLPQPPALAVAAVPAETLAQRPDLAALERELVAASGEVGIAEADRYPQLRLSGSIGYAAFRALGTTGKATTWSFGPALSLPLFDGDRRAGVVDQAQARFDELVANYRERVHAAVREVEVALVRVESAGDRLGDAERGADRVQTSLKAAQSRYDTGAGSVFELEDARRQALNAAAALLQVRAERVAAWLSLYKALGGGWRNDAAGANGDPAGANGDPAGANRPPPATPRNSG